MKNSATVLSMFVFILVLIVLFGLGPILTILSMNALFGLSIALSFGTWLSVFWLSMIAVGIVKAGVILGIRDTLNNKD